MTPAALSILTTSFHDGPDRVKALGVWSGTVPLASALGVVLGGVLSQGPGWRWVFFVNAPISALVLVGALRLLDDDQRRAPLNSFDAVGGILSTAVALHTADHRRRCAVDPRHAQKRCEYLPSYEALLAWSAHAGAITDEDAFQLRKAAVDDDSAAATQVHARALVLREAVYGTFAAHLKGHEPAGPHLDVLNEELHHALARRAAYR